MRELEYPQDLRYTTEHEWVRAGSDGVIRVGITAYAQDALAMLSMSACRPWATP